MTTHDDASYRPRVGWYCRGCIAELVAMSGQPIGGVLEEAAAVTAGRRQADYGPPGENHERTALMHVAYLRGRLQAQARAAFPGGVPHELEVFIARIDLTGRDVCMFDILQKVSRDAHAPKRDNLVDIAGYAANAGACA